MYKPRVRRNPRRAQSVVEYIILFAIVIMVSVALAQRAPSIFSGYRNHAIEAMK
jgi:hypothetical protein